MVMRFLKSLIFARHITLLTLLSVLVASCGQPQVTSSPSTTTPSTSANFNTTALVEIVRSTNPPEKRIISEEIIPQNNCRGTAAVSNEYEKSRTIVYSVEVGGGVSVNASGEASIPSIGKVQVGAEIAASYGVSYGQSETVSRRLSVTAREGTNVNHRIHQIEYWEGGEIVLMVDDQEMARYPYQIRTGFGLELVDVSNIACDNSTLPVSSATTFVPQPIETSTATPGVVLTQSPSSTTSDKNTPEGSVLAAGEVWIQDGLEMQVKNPTFIPGCDGVLGFEMAITNRSGRELLIDLTGKDISATDEFDRNYSSEKMWWREGGQSDSCYPKALSAFELRALRPGERVDIAIRLEPIADTSSSQFTINVFRAGPITNAKWEVSLPVSSDNSINTNPSSILNSGETWTAGGLEVQIKNPTFIPGCDGVLGFEMAIINSSGRELLIDLTGKDISATDEFDRNYSSEKMWWREGGQSDSCYPKALSAFELRALRPGERVDIAIRVEPLEGKSPSEFIILVSKMGPVENAAWNLKAQ